ncbi:hypothetical protein [Curtobacterium sp. MCLR17_034]|uniref:hypothetical protein n=1 Tax=Curtobacterium sp. MCLR17_034 TaxID=2175623 RepID=UPI0011B38F38|nr:hypothetical protein [Curtobacterium sp. MCLR17_034]
MSVLIRFIVPLLLLTMSVYFLVSAVIKLQSNNPGSGVDQGLEVQIVVYAIVGILLALVIFIVAAVKHRQHRGARAPGSASGGQASG